MEYCRGLRHFSERFSCRLWRLWPSPDLGHRIEWRGHELRSPLNAILGFAQLLELGAPAPTSTQAASVSQIVKAGWHLLELIDEILDLTLIESGRLSLSLEPTSLRDVLQDCQAMIAPLWFELNAASVPQ